MKSRCTAVALLVILALGGVVPLMPNKAGAASKPPPSSKGERKILGELELRSPAGEEVSLIPLFGRKAVLLVFWTTGCPACRAEVPRLNRLNAEDRVKVVAVNETENPPKVKEFINTHRVGYQVVLDPDGAVASAFQVPGIPFCVILGRSGLIVYRGSNLPEEIDYYAEQ